MLHVAMVEPHPQTPTYLLVCAHTYHRTVLDPVNVAATQHALGEDKLDLILLTTPTEYTLAAAELLQARTGAPILAGENLRETRLPVARYLGNGEIVGVGPLAQTLWLPEGGITAYAFGSEGVVFTGPLFATGVARHKANAKAIGTLANLPDETQVCGGGAHNLPLRGLLEAAYAS
ncbi:MAG: hypothetical protein INF43_04550 [Alphaproteobacteria bacterium]|jgi:hypothetical protein|nr:hypothetical protein [Alphaproteobacteria bacterium]